jgi:thiamine biosynthesis lipoprotein
LRFTLLVLLTIIAALAGCSDPLYKQRVYAFDTLAEVSIYGEDEKKAREAAGAVLAEFNRLHLMLHPWKGGELARLNAAFGASASAPVSPELASIIEDAARRSAQSGGSFNPAIGKLIGLWGFHADEVKPVHPSDQQIGALVEAKPGMADIAIADRRASSVNVAAALDLRDYASGYALDRAREILQAQGIRNALIAIGGNMIALGERGPRPWKVGIQHPRQEGPIATIELYDGEALATRGDYQRFFERDNQRYSDLIDPKRGHPVRGTEQVVVLSGPGENAAVAATVATVAVFIAAPADWRTTAQRMGVDQVMRVDDQGEVYLTGALARRIELKLPKPVTHEVP